ncbi:MULTISPECIES: hypothetical protein [Burkholderia]|uniref:Uncharacterized protein n=1 Tax=Burkholderia contaminans TaxID=488447 RepID=A0A6P3A7L1_9BURK|nr:MULTISPECIES: hypothetical protein [Burkholderia]VWD39795.1 hypothetical protein BCO71033_04512 [Burkholderia contaminans]
MPLVLNMRTRDRYVELIGGHPFENDSHNLDRMPFEATATSGDDAERGFSLDSAIRGPLRTQGGDKRMLRPDDRFLAQSLVVFCVAESLRFDRMREIVGQPRSRLSPADRQASARVDLVGFGPSRRACGY